MNRISIVNDQIKKTSLNKCIEFEFEECDSLFGINKLIINIIDDTNLDIDIKLTELAKIEIVFNINNNKKFKLNILSSGIEGKIQYKYNLDEKSSIDIDRFNNICNLKEMNIINLNGENSIFNSNSKTISISKESYNYMIYHNKGNSTSNIKNNGINIKDGILNYQVSTFIPKNINSCSANQYNRIINLTDNKCEIKPNLYIDSYDVSANHSALIGKFDDNELFYLKSRGIDEDTAIRLLIRGFLLSDIESKTLINNITKLIDKYWR